MEQNILGHKKIFLSVIIIIVFINVLDWIFLIWKLPYSSTPFLLHYNVYFGVDLYGEWWKLLVSPATGSLTIGLNILFIFLLRQILNFSSFVIMGVTLFLQLMVSIALLFMVLLNI